MFSVAGFQTWLKSFSRLAILAIPLLKMEHGGIRANQNAARMNISDSTDVKIGTLLIDSKVSSSAIGTADRGLQLYQNGNLNGTKQSALFCLAGC